MNFILDPFRLKRTAVEGGLQWRLQRGSRATAVRLLVLAAAWGFVAAGWKDEEFLSLSTALLLSLAVFVVWERYSLTLRIDDSAARLEVRPAFWGWLCPRAIELSAATRVRALGRLPFLKVYHGESWTLEFVPPPMTITMGKSLHNEIAELVSQQLRGRDDA